MVQAIHSNKKGIYKNLYLEIESENKKKAQENARKRSPKGIYKDLYTHLDNKYFTGNEDQKRKSLYSEFFQHLQKGFSTLTSRFSYFFSIAGSELKMLMLAFFVAKKPVSNYIENNLNTYSNQENY